MRLGASLACLIVAYMLVNVVSYTPLAEADRVTSLPGATSAMKSNQFSGYLNISDSRGIHYMYFESERNPASDSVVFWTNGGPGKFSACISRYLLGFMM